VELVDDIQKVLIQKSELLKCTVKAYLFSLGNELLGLLGKSTLNPWQAFILVLLQQLVPASPVRSSLP
jgi:hypothetical protein